MLDGKKTYTGIAAMLLAFLGQQLGVDLGDGTEIITAVITLAGAAFAIYGRLAARPKADNISKPEGDVK